MYPVTYMYIDLPIAGSLLGDINSGDAKNLYRISSDGYYTRASFMYVADPHSPAHINVNIEEKSNIEVVQNSY